MYGEIDHEEGLRGQHALLDTLSERFKVNVDNLKSIGWVGPDDVPGTVRVFFSFFEF